MRALAATLCLLPGPALAGFLDIFRKRNPEPEPEPFLIFGFAPLSVAAAGLTVVLVALLIRYRPPFIMEILRGMVGDMLAWVLAVMIASLVMVLYLYAFTDLGVIGALAMAVVTTVIVFIVMALGS